MSPNSQSVTEASHSVTAVERREELSLLTLANVILKSRGLVLRVILGCAALGAVVGLLAPDEYTAQSVIYPRAAQDTRLQLAGLAAQFGVNVPTGAQGGESPEFYAELLESRSLLQEVVTAELAFTREIGDSDTIRSTLIEVYGIDLEPPVRAVRAASARLANQLNVRAAANTGLVHISTEAQWPGLAVVVNEHILDVLREFNMRRRQQNAFEERRFVEERMNNAHDELQRAEDRFQEFLEQNRAREAAQLQFEESRLSRQVNLRQQVYTSLAQSYEQVRIEEVRNTPGFTVVETASASLRETGYGVVTWTALALLVGLVLSLIVAFMRYAVERQKAEDPASYQEFEALRGSLLSDNRLIAGVRNIIRRSE